MLALAACKSPRPPHEAAEGDVSGEWTAESVAIAKPEPAGQIARRRFLLGERHPRRFHINFTLHLNDGGEMKFDGSVMDVRTLVGQVALRGDTIPVTFTRP